MTSTLRATVHALIGLLVASGLVPRDAAAEVPIPAITAPVTDHAGALAAGDAVTLEERLRALRDRTGVHMAVVIVPTLAGTPIEEFAAETFRAWGGGSAEHDDGLLLVVSMGDRRKRLEVGYGLEPSIPDSAAATLLDAMNPGMRAGRLGEAMVGLVDGLAARVAHLTPGDRPPASERGTGVPLAVPVAISVTAWLTAFALLLRPAAETHSERRRRRRKGLPPPPEPATLRHRPALRGLVWLALPAVVFVVAALAVGVWLALELGLAWLMFAALGSLHARAHRAGPVRKVACAVMVGVYVLALGAISFSLPPTTDTGRIFALSLIPALILGLPLFLMAVAEVGPGSTSATSSTGVGDRVSSTSGDTSTASAYDSGSSGSSDSSSWSGGGGESGGGGASDSW